MNKRAFTLIETMVSIFVMVVGIVGALALIQQTISYIALSSSRLIASYLTQEGIEIVRNIRDGNWLEQRTNPAISWTDGLSTGDWEADYNDPSLTFCSSPCNYQNLRFLKIDGGFYNYESETDTKFKRKITITPDIEGPGSLKVSVQVEWQQIGKTHQMTAQEYLYNWVPF